jgi:hypothetical protein
MVNGYAEGGSIVQGGMKCTMAEHNPMIVKLL